MVVHLVVALLLAASALALGAGQARASDGGMSGMDGMGDMSGMSQEEMQNMTPPPAVTPAAAATAMSSGSMSGSGSMQSGQSDHGGQAMDPGMDMDGGTVNWLVIGGFIALIAGSTLGAMATKRHLARRMAAGELAGAGALDV